MSDENNNLQNETQINENDYNEQEKIRREKLAELIENGNNPYFITKYEVDSDTKQIIENFEESEGKDVKIAGRLMSRRNMGKANFINIADFHGIIQAYVRLDDVSEEKYMQFKKWDIGDIIGINGKVFKTKTGEVSIHAYGIDLLSKSLVPLPEKFHGLKDAEIKFRQRYLDLIMNREVKDMFVKKQLFWETVRNFMSEKGFLEVETPVLEVNSGGAAATPFKTHHNALDIDVFLRISMGELWQKKLLVAGFEKTFEIGRQFRNEGMSNEHLQDYTQMEFYWAYADCRDGMELVKELYRKITKAVTGGSKFISHGFEIDMDKEWVLYDFEDIIKSRLDIGIYDANIKQLKSKLDELHVAYDPKLNYWRLVDVLWKVVRKDLSGPGFLVGQPVQLNPLPKRLEKDPRKADQMQVIIAGSEMGNGYSELNDPLDLEKRFREQRIMGEAGDTEAHNHDQDFIDALNYGMPPAFGFGVSERLFSFIMDRPMRECVLFPLMKPKE
ncbi:MAG: lysine--tRNA ligase [Oscillospiraceae bacterium]|nr:lysine--tRNA ligase [Oscillospiraceae bacterium]